MGDACQNLTNFFKGSPFTALHAEYLAKISLSFRATTAALAKQQFQAMISGLDKLAAIDYLLADINARTELHGVPAFECRTCAGALYEFFRERSTNEVERNGPYGQPSSNQSSGSMLLTSDFFKKRRVSVAADVGADASQASTDAAEGGGKKLVPDPRLGGMFGGKSTGRDAKLKRLCLGLLDTHFNGGRPIGYIKMKTKKRDSDATDDNDTDDVADGLDADDDTIDFVQPTIGFIKHACKRQFESIFKMVYDEEKEAAGGRHIDYEIIKRMSWASVAEWAKSRRANSLKKARRLAGLSENPYSIDVASLAEKPGQSYPVLDHDDDTMKELIEEAQRTKLIEFIDYAPEEGNLG
jgi:hypothetical protein